MQDIAPIVQLVLVLAAVASPVILFARLVSGGEQGSLASLFTAPDTYTWPRGVQEEDPKPWVLGATVPAAA
ncbi:MAG TPA: hypothetical protein VIZ22_00215 [Candidatus Limnocylindrales bacterium]